MPNSNPRSFNYGKRAGEAFPGEGDAVERAHVITEAHKSTTAQSGMDQGDTAKDAVQRKATE